MQSATGLRERNLLRTSAELTSLARSRTAEAGLTGFTVEELCEAVGVSRRTFFNHFASKEDAILGFPVHRDAHGLDEAFLEGGAGDRGPSGLTRSLLTDLADLAAARWELDGIGAAEAALLLAAIEREPRLLARLLERSRAQEAGDTLLVEQRERLAPGDPRAVTAVHVMGSLFRAAVEEFLTAAEPAPFGELLAVRLTAARTVFSA